MSKYLPQELVEQIIFKVPIKSLVHFSSVSKEWYKFVTKPEPLENNRNRFLLCFYLGKNEYVFYYNKDGEFKEYARFKGPEEDGSILDVLRTSSNDYVQCVCGILWNPSIRKLLRLPRSDDDHFLITFGL
ncbi:hypothetical protein LIER_42478 [Lithospermum erythrorhizon]|uniref:F-box domain-containing protein n=1 Tax=Lithospermum erythrorhizon TaxID=34254 RepID=A0AAV3RQZ5_LITER